MTDPAADPDAQRLAGALVEIAGKAQVRAVLLFGSRLVQASPDRFSAFDLVGMTSVTSAQGDAIAISVVNGEILLNDSSTVTISNVIASNGVAHVVNVVLIPPG